MKAYKGFEKDMTCRGFQYKEGETYATDNAKLCREGFHACEHPLDCLKYYAPCDSVYHEVDIDGYTDTLGRRDTKLATTKITIGAELDIEGLVRASIGYAEKKSILEKRDGFRCISFVGGDRNASVVTGNSSVSATLGNYNVSLATGCSEVSCAIGTYSASCATGDGGSSSVTGFYSASSATGEGGISSATGNSSTSSVSGKGGVAVTTGIGSSSSTENAEGLAVAWGGGYAKGVVGSYLVLSDWGLNDEWRDFALREAKMIRVDGEKIKADTWYTLINGEITEKR